MTTAALSRLNRDITILYRHLLGDSAIGIAAGVQLHHNVVSRIIKRGMKDPRMLEAAEMMKAERIKEVEVGYRLG